MAKTEFQREQARVSVGMAGAALTTLIVLLAGLLLAPPPPPELDQRLIGFARCEVWMALPLTIGVASLARRRFLSPDDIAGAADGHPGAAVARGRAVLQNTLEQTLLAVLVQFGLAALSPEGAKLAPTLVGLFLVGRVLFALGYARGARARAFGFGLTFYPTLAGLAFVLLLAVAGA